MGASLHLSLEVAMSKTIRSTGPGMTKAETVAGLLYLPFYVVGLSAALRYGASLLGLALTDLQLNILHLSLQALICILLFRRFLAANFRAIDFWPLVQAVILGYVLYRAGNFLLALLLTVLDLTPTSYNDELMQVLASESFPLTVLCSVVLAPLSEELLCRGLVFGGLHRKSRLLAYCVSILFFSALHVWQFIPQHGFAALWPAVLLYVPASLALCWCHEKAGTVWAPIFLHMACNAVTMGLM